jgi:hypothetical protein
MKDLAENPAAVRALARYLLVLVGRDEAQAWTDWEVDFLESMATRECEEPLSMRQREVLSGLKSAAERHSEIDGMGVRSLIERCWLERADLDSDEDQEFIVALRTSGQRTVTGRQRWRLVRCCRELGVIEGYQGITA